MGSFQKNPERERFCILSELQNSLVSKGQENLGLCRGRTPTERARWVAVVVTEAALAPVGRGLSNDNILGLKFTIEILKSNFVKLGVCTRWLWSWSTKVQVGFSWCE